MLYPMKKPISFFCQLPLCESLFENEDKIPGVTCDNSTMIEVAEIRHRDPIFERLLSQIWSDFQYKLNTEAQLYGHVLDPFDVDAKLPEPIDIRQVGTGYTADVQMHGIKVRETGLVLVLSDTK